MSFEMEPVHFYNDQENQLIHEDLNPYSDHHEYE